MQLSGFGKSYPRYKKVSSKQTCSEFRSWKKYMQIAFLLYLDPVKLTLTKKYHIYESPNYRIFRFIRNCNC